MKLGQYRDPEAPDVDVQVRSQWISDPAYAEMVQKSVVACTDVIFTVADDIAIYLGKRCVYPMKGVWCFGGRIFFNDKNLEESIARCVRTETSYGIEAQRFELVCANTYSWIRVAQGDFGGKNLAITYRCEVTREEITRMENGLSPTEYERDFGIQRFTRERLVDERIHPAMVDIYDQLFPK